MGFCAVGPVHDNSCAGSSIGSSTCVFVGSLGGVELCGLLVSGISVLGGVILLLPFIGRLRWVFFFLAGCVFCLFIIPVYYSWWASWGGLCDCLFYV